MTHMEEFYNLRWEAARTENTILIDALEDIARVHRPYNPAAVGLHDIAVAALEKLDALSDERDAITKAQGGES